MSDKTTFDTWAIVEIMGHVTMAGRVTEQAIGGQGFIRVDVPESGKQAAFTRFYGPGAIYSITPVDEQTGRLAVANLRQEPITIYGLAARQLPAGQTRVDRRYYGDGELTYQQPDDDRRPFDDPDDPDYGQVGESDDEDEDEPEAIICQVCGQAYGQGWSNCTCGEAVVAKMQDEAPAQEELPF